jgi:cytochrome oxidase Cu insertion factor (SCO1/SenC/PrrC family)
MSTFSLAAVCVVIVVGQPPRGRDDRPERPDRSRDKAKAQKAKSGERDTAFEKASPRVGELLPEVSVWDGDGKPFSTRTLRGHYSVLVFGCLT